MKILGRIIKKEPSYILPLPFNGKVDVRVKRGDDFKSGDILFSRMTKKIIESHHIPTQLGVKVKDSGDYIARLGGEYVEKGEVLAERLMSGGLVVKRIVATQEGILSLDRVDKGYLDIMSSTEVTDVKIDFRGKVESIDSNNGMHVRANAWVMRIITSMRAAEDDLSSSFIGEFTQIGDGTSVYTQKDLKESYEGCIVYAGRFVYPDLVRELYRRGAELVVAYAMDYEDYSAITEPIVLLGGFGSVVFDSHWERVVSSMFGSFAAVNIKEGCIAWGDKGQFMNRSVNDSDELFVPSIKPGMYVLVTNQESLNRVGLVREVASEGIASVEFEDRSISLIDTGFLKPIQL